MTDSNSVELFDVEFFLTENQTSKVEILLFWGFVLPSDFPKSGGDPVYGTQTPIYWQPQIHTDSNIYWL